MPAPEGDAAAVLARGALRGVPVEPFGPVWSCARLKLSRAGWQGAGLEPFLTAAVPYASTSSGRLSEDAVDVVLAALPDRAGLRILELGAGSGVFARLFLDALHRRAPGVYAASHYLVTDGSDSVLAALQASGVLAAHAGRCATRRLDLGAGWPDLGRFDVILGSYVLDSLPFDLLALNDARTWRLEARAVLAPEDAGEAEALAQALRLDTPEALAPFVALGPRLSCHTRHVAVDRDTLPRGRDLPDDTGGRTLPYIHSHGALDCIDAAIDHLAEGGVAIFSDYGQLEAYAGRQSPEFQTFGTSIAMGINFPQIESACRARPGATLFRPAEEDGHLYTRVLRRGAGPDLADLVDDRFGALRYRAHKATVDAARECLRGRMYERARGYYAMALAQQPRNWTLMQEIAAMLHLAGGEFAEAIDMARLGLALNPLSPDLWRVVAEAELGLDRPQAAAAAAGRAVALAPAHVGAQRALARAELRQGRLGAALQAVAQALTNDVETDEQEALLALQTQILAEIARRQMRVLLAGANPFRALDGLPEG
jgi:tetratricopeptide (TPR) repeat protein